jgi:hypothetical protein
LALSDSKSIASLDALLYWYSVSTQGRRISAGRGRDRGILHVGAGHVTEGAELIVAD